LPSSLSALRFSTFASELTVIGALPASTCRSSAVAPLAVLLLSSLSTGHDAHHRGHRPDGVLDVQLERGALPRQGSRGGSQD
jgi:hypothetical protein